MILIQSPRDRYLIPRCLSRVVAMIVLSWAMGAMNEEPGWTLDRVQTGNDARQKVIKDPAEYNAYMAAFNTQDPASRAAAMDAFAKQYPQSVVLSDALEQAMTAYQMVRDPAKVMEKARQLLEVNPRHVQALGVVTYVDRVNATSGDQAAFAEMCRYSQTNLELLASWERPAGMEAPDFEKVRTQLNNVFCGAAGFCALQRKNYSLARDYLTVAFKGDPASLQDVYQLAVADLEMNPIDINGLWYCSKALALAQQRNQTSTVTSVTRYCKDRYNRYHGSEDGWDRLLASTAGESALPADFSNRVQRAPTPCEMAVSVVEQNDPLQLGFGDKEFILAKANCSLANKLAADKVWQSIQTMEKNGEARLQIPVKIISATRQTLEAAISEDSQNNNKADVHIELEKPVLNPPAPGTLTNITGVITKYTPDPFLFTMEKAALSTPAVPQRP